MIQKNGLIRTYFFTGKKEGMLNDEVTYILDKYFMSKSFVLI